MYSKDRCGVDNLLKKTALLITPVGLEGINRRLKATLFIKEVTK